MNQGCEGLQEKFGELRVSDTELGAYNWSGIGLSLRGLRPIAEMQYLDYVIYGFQPMVDDISFYIIELMVVRYSFNYKNQRT